jgi:hypothetical protein
MIEKEVNMRRLYQISLAAMLLLAISAAGCASAPTPNAPTQAPTLPPSPTATSPPTAEPTIDYAKQLEDFDPSNFDNPTNIDNQWLPLQPGTQLVLDGVTEEAGNRIAHQIIFTVTDLTKVIDGVRTVVAYVVDISNNQPVEREIAFYAQDNDGNVWYLGEYPEVYEYEKIVEAPAWIAGLKGAKAGIKMKVEPQLGMPSYSQGWGPAVNWTDRGQVAQMGQQTCVPVDCYEDVLVIEEFSREETGAFQLKYYAPGVGNVRVGWRGADATKEELELFDYVQLGPEALAGVRAEALEQEKRGYEISKEVYAQTLPMEVPTEATIAVVTPEKVFEDFDPINFDDPTHIDNPWLPLQPGTQWVFEGFTIEDGEEIPHRLEFTVTDLTKEIDGVRTVVAYILDYSDGQLVEKEIAFYAQDNDGNVWYLGEHPEEYEGGEFVNAPTWISGLEEAKAGIKMMAQPQVGTPSYFQGWGPVVGWTDYAQVDEMGQELCVPIGCFQDVLVTAESSLEEVDIFQLKYYASGVGNVRVGWRGAAAAQEELEAVVFDQLSPAVLAEIRRQALELEQHAYEVSADVYGQTPPAEPPSASTD